MAPGFFGCLSAAILIILAGLYGYMQALNLSAIASAESFRRKRKRLVNMLFLNVFRVEFKVVVVQYELGVFGALR